MQSKSLGLNERESNILEAGHGCNDGVFLDCQKDFDTEPYNKLRKNLEFQAGGRKVFLIGLKITCLGKRKKKNTCQRNQLKLSEILSSGVP